MIKLIVNADDFGLSQGVNQGIIKAYVNGIVTSTTLFVNMPYTKEAVELAKRFPNLGVGVHLNVTIGKPLTNCPSLVDENGYFKKSNKDELLNKDELYQEWKAQIDKALSLLDRMPSHLDSHHHIHRNPAYVDIVKRLSKEYNLPVREIDATSILYQPLTLIELNADRLSFKYLNQHMEDNKAYEIMCHPGILDDYLQQNSSYNKQRQQELDFLCQDQLQKWISTRKIELLSYYNLSNL